MKRTIVMSTVILIGVGISTAALMDVQRSLVSTRWPVVEGRVTASRVPSGGGPPIIQYEYEVTVGIFFHPSQV